MENIKKIIDSKRFFWALCLLGSLLFLSIFKSGWQQLFPDIYVFLADAFLHGKMSLSAIQGGHDLSLFQGVYYAPQGPMPAILLMPFVYLFGVEFNLAYFQFVFHVINLYLLFKVARTLGLPPVGAILLSFLFVFSTVYLSIGKYSSYTYVAHAVTIACGLGAILFFLKKCSYFWIGCLCAGMLATRTTAGLGAFFFIMYMVEQWNKDKKAFHHMVLFLAPILITGCLLLLYNYVRFHNLFEFGYNFQQINIEFIANTRGYGLFSFMHVPGNIYSFLFQAPDQVFLNVHSAVLTFPFIQPNIWGLGMVFISPFLLYLFGSPNKTNVTALLWRTILWILIPLLFYYGIGVKQYGYRYGLDFYPFLYWLFVLKIKGQVTPLFIRVCLLSVGLNLYLFSFYS